MGFGDAVNEFANSEDGQNMKNDALNKTGDAANNATGGQFEDQIDQGREAVGSAFGGQDQGQQSDQGLGQQDQGQQNGQQNDQEQF